MNEREFTNRIKQDLNYGLGQMAPDITARLKQAREYVLDSLDVETAQQEAFAFGGRAGGHGHIGSRKWASIMMLIALVAAGIYWTESTQQEEDDIDAALLSDDLPVNAYTDHDFYSWLNRSSQY